MKFLRVGICALIAFAVAAQGGVEEWAQAGLETGTGLLFIFWAVRACFHREEPLVLSPLLPPMGIFAVLACIQLVFHRTAYAFDTRTELQLLVSYVLIVFLAAQVFRDAPAWKLFMWFVMGFGFLVAIFGMLQHLTFNGKLYWFREMRYGGIPFGPYVNRNHFAGFAELVIPLSLVPLVLGKVRRERWPVIGIFALVPIGALFLSASRGGIVSFGVELGVLALFMAFRHTGGRNVLAGALVLTLALLMVSWIGVHQILERFSSLQSLEVSVVKRASMRANTWRIFRDHPWTGTGLGTLQTVFPPYETLYDGKIVNHTHNDYLEALAETGIAGAACCAWFLGALFFRSLRLLMRVDTSFPAALHLSGLIACTGFLTHSLVDFNLHIPANALLFFLTAQLAIAEVAESAQRKARRRHRKTAVPENAD